MSSEDLYVWEPTDDPEEINLRFQKLVEAVRNEQANAHHDYSGFSTTQAIKGKRQLQRFVKEHKDILPEDCQDLVDSLYW